MNQRVLEVRPDDGRLRVSLGGDLTEHRSERVVDWVVADGGAEANDELYLDLRKGSRNCGAVDHEALVAGLPQTIVRNPDGAYQLFRIGDAVASRNIHAAIYDALRLVKDL